MKLEIKELHASVEGKEILKGLNLTIQTGEIHAIMGPNGAGKSTLSHVIMGNPKYEVTAGQVLLDGEDVLEMDVDERARKGLFMAFQYPVEIPGITVGRFLKRATEIQDEAEDGQKARTFVKDLRANMKFLDMDQQFINRYLNEGFSGGEKKRMEILQMLMLKPAFGILDETDSGLDIDALKVVAKGVNQLRGDDFGSIIITHYQRILNHIKPDYVHILFDGRIVTSGGEDLVEALEEKGYDWVREQYGIPEEAVNEQ
ncbi:Fe-S cluster assembly ATPase SufC [Salinispira pacifica]|uniref:Iron-sulfur cluster assembly ATPase protein SufC n=1 Tax=Salinispira pacifica TaxID=1307761 RepID=V5WGI9_9SPIO|nr:Fe-S cluster assembly ATPase SufC [Salinispira pacifica]AHC14281.1 Iron-sulfur cluster assembly ATPase protein SufC [Salinispira pacifica]